MTANSARGESLPTGAAARFGTTRFHVTGGVDSLSLSPDNKLLACGDRRAHVRVLDASTGELRYDLGQEGALGEPTFSGDGSVLACVQATCIQLRDARTGRLLSTIQAHRHWISAIAWSPHAKLLASAAPEDNSVKLWDSANGRSPIRTLNVEEPYAAGFSPDGKLLAVGGWEGPIRVYVAATGQLAWAGQGHSAWCRALAFSPDGTLLATGSSDHSCYVWDTSTGKVRFRLKGIESSVLAIAFAHSGKWFATVSEYGAIRCWDAGTGKLSWDSGQLGSFPRSVAFSADDNTLFSGHESGSVWIWRRSGVTYQKSEGAAQVRALAIDPSGPQLLTGGDDGQISVWDWHTHRPLRQISAHGGKVPGIAGLVITRDGGTVISAGLDGAVRFCDPRSGKERRPAIALPSRIFCLALSPDEKTLATGGDDRRIHLWDVASGQEVSTLAGHTGSVLGLAFSPDGARIASAGGDNDNAVRMWDRAAGKVVRKWKLHRVPVCVAFSPDGTLLGSGVQDAHVMLWRVRDGQKVAELSGHTNTVNCLNFSPDGKLLASGGWDNTVCVWDVTSYRLRSRLAGHIAWVTCLGFSPDGRYLASGSEDSTVLLWDIHFPGRLPDGSPGKR